MKKYIIMALVLLIAVSFFPSAVAEKTEIAYTFISDVEARVPLFFEPSQTSPLFGEYFNGVKVNVLEHISDKWVKVQIVTWEGVEGVQMYMENKYLVYGEEGETVGKTTALYVVDAAEVSLSAAAHGQSTYFGPFAAGTQMELLGIITNATDNYDRGLEINDTNNRLHFKVDDVSGFFDAAAIEALQLVK